MDGAPTPADVTAALVASARREDPKRGHVMRAAHTTSCGRPSDVSTRSALGRIPQCLDGSAHRRRRRCGWRRASTRASPLVALRLGMTVRRYSSNRCHLTPAPFGRCDEGRGRPGVDLQPVNVGRTHVLVVVVVTVAARRGKGTPDVAADGHVTCLLAWLLASSEGFEPRTSGFVVIVGLSTVKSRKPGWRGYRGLSSRPASLESIGLAATVAAREMRFPPSAGHLLMQLAVPDDRSSSTTRSGNGVGSCSGGC